MFRFDVYPVMTTIINFNKLAIFGSLVLAVLALALPAAAWWGGGLGGWGGGWGLGGLGGFGSFGGFGWPSWGGFGGCGLGSCGLGWGSGLGWGGMGGWW